MPLSTIFFFFFFNDTATTEIYTLSLHDALPICRPGDHHQPVFPQSQHRPVQGARSGHPSGQGRSEEHTSELQSQSNLVCRLLLEKKKKKIKTQIYYTPTNLENSSSRLGSATAPS